MIDFKKIIDEDPEFKDFMLKVNEAMLFSNPEFTSLAMFLYGLYQAGISAKVASSAMINSQKYKKAAE